MPTTISGGAQHSEPKGAIPLPAIRRGRWVGDGQGGAMVSDDPNAVEIAILAADGDGVVITDNLSLPAVGRVLVDELGGAEVYG